VAAVTARGEEISRFCVAKLLMGVIYGARLATTAAIVLSYENSWGRVHPLA